MIDQPTDEDLAYMAHMEKQRQEADALIADPDVDTPGADTAG